MKTTHLMFLLASTIGIATTAVAGPALDMRSGKQKCHFCEGKCVNPSFQNLES